MTEHPETDLHVTITDVEQLPEQGQTRFKMTLGGRIVIPLTPPWGSDDA